MIHSGTDIWKDSAETEGNPRLALLPPTDLPSEIRLDGSESDAMRGLLHAFLSALDATEPAQRVAWIGALLAGLDQTFGTRAMQSADGPTGSAEVADFDGYFNVRRICGGPPAFALAHGMLQTAQAVLAPRGPDLPEAQLRIQIDGFASYARLLARICGLGELR